MKKTPVYITGHQHPDTDSVASAIAYSFFKRSQGVQAVPCRLGKLNGETKYLLDRFGLPEPQLLADARVTLGEVAMEAAGAGGPGPGGFASRRGRPAASSKASRASCSWTEVLGLSSTQRSTKERFWRLLPWNSLWRLWCLLRRLGLGRVFWRWAP